MLTFSGRVAVLCRVTMLEPACLANRCGLQRVSAAAQGLPARTGSAAKKILKYANLLNAAAFADFMSERLHVFLFVIL